MNSDTGTLVLLIVLIALVAVMAFFVVLSSMKVSSLSARRQSAGPTDFALAELRDAVYRLERGLAEIGTPMPSPGVDLEPVHRQFSALRERVDALAADFDRYANPPIEESVRPSLAELEARAAALPSGSDADEAFRRQCRAEIESLQTIQGKCAGPSDWVPEAGDRSFLLNELFSPKRMDLLEVTTANRAEARALITFLDDARAELIEELRSRFGIEPIAPVPGSAFDPSWHEDNPSTRQTPPDPSKSNLVYERVSVGFAKRGEVLERSWVKRYAAGAGESQVPQDEPVPPIASDPLPPLEPPGPAEASESLLRRAAADD
ncbi:MAG TPA: hypothetical protein PLL78_00145 [Fimbriimonadaceae bacterium]|nr:hypothetical protein [Fimbriimonadaceae bacterium]HRJ95070.1 hypothetical protein [Fimbriimonadaceae bacterium]